MSPATPSPPSSSLADAINAATRSTHAKLNKLIIARLPLAVPPVASGPSVYVSGLLHIAPIYLTFETLWADLLHSPPAQPTLGRTRTEDGCDPETPVLDSESMRLLPNQGQPLLQHLPLLCDRMRSVLLHLQLPGLLRSERLRSDIRELTGWTAEGTEEQLSMVAQAGRLSEFVLHIKRSLEKKPHILIAYSYIMYMALFAGGRYIRATLESAGQAFWSAPDSASPADTMVDLESGQAAPSFAGMTHIGHNSPLQFFHFSTPQDGEDLKAEFKQRLVEVEGLLSARERHDIVQEATCIFDNMILLISQLDAVCGTPNLERKATAGSISPLLGSTLVARLRDSVAVAKERSCKAARKSAAESDTSKTMTPCPVGGQHDVATAPAAEHHWHSHSATSDKPSVPGERSEPVCCAVLSKSVRFDQRLAVPDRKPPTRYSAFSTDGASDSDQFPVGPFMVNRVTGRQLLANVLAAMVLAVIMGYMLFRERHLL